tara:strand:- start:334 stop:1152 length:819 start_codon:yes stop_codon:yes gene_type:complete
MAVNTVAQGNISISSINTENASTTSNSLKTLSETAVEGLSTLNEAPFAMSEFSGYEHFAWGTPGVPSGFNVGLIFNMEQERRNGGDTCVVCSFNMTLNTSTKIIAVNIVGTDDGGGVSQAFTISPAFQVSYTGDITSLEGRFVYSGENIACSGSSGDVGKVLELFSSTSSISATDINNNQIVGSNVTLSNDISSGASGTFRSLRTTTGNMAIALAATCDNVSNNDFSIGKIAFSGSDSLTIQLRANGSSTVNLFSRSGTFDMEAQSTEEDTS